MKASYSTGEAIAIMAEVLTRVDDRGRSSLGDEECLALVRESRRLAERVTALAGVLMIEADRRLCAEHVHGNQLTELLTTEEHLDPGKPTRRCVRRGAWPRIPALLKT